MGRKKKEDVAMEDENVQKELLDAIAQEQEKELSENISDSITVPTQTDPHWSDYVLSQFTDQEVVVKYKKNTKEEVGRYPKVNGLRRIARMFVGDILESYPTPVQVIYAPLDGWCAACFTYTVIFKLKDGTQLKYSDVGEILNTIGNRDFSNIDAKFGRFPSSIAVTRAEARTLRKALGLNTVAFEELDTDQKDRETGDEQPAYIKDIQKQAIKVFCKRHGIDVMKYIKSGPYNYDSLDKISLSHAINMWQQLEEFQRKTKELEQYKTQYNLSI